MLPRAVHRSIAWLLIGAFALVGGAGEGLHLIPGCGHGVEVGQTVVLLGIDPSDAQVPTPDGPSRVASPEKRSIPVYDEDSCAICSAVGEYRHAGGPVQLVLAVPLAHDLPMAAVGEVHTVAACPFQPRAPPLG
jgi:hypothetical protein